MKYLPLSLFPGTVKTIVEEKARDGNKLENVFYHLSYEKQGEFESTPEPMLETDQTVADDATLVDVEETTTPLMDNEETRNTAAINEDEDEATTERVQIISKYWLHTKGFVYRFYPARS